MTTLVNAERAQELIDQCRTWCTLMDIEPTTGCGDEDLMICATLDYMGEFKDLNDAQRQVIAGVRDLVDMGVS